MSETLVWWLALQVVGLAALPLCLLLFRWLPDRGYSLSKAFALIILGYAFWVFNIPFDANTTATVWWLIVLLAAGSGYAFWRRREELLSFVRSHWRLIAAIEALFFLAFITGAYLRSYTPEISGTEKPMDFMFLNALLQADGFPPHDPWLEGWNVAYYYFGYLIVAIMTRLSSVEAAVGFNLGLAMIAALAVVGACGLVYNLVAMREQGDREPEPAPKRSRRKAAQPAQPPAERGPAISWRGFGFGIAAGLLLAIIGNLEGALEFFAAHGVGSNGFWDWVGIRDSGSGQLAVTAYDSSKWYGDRHWAWWASTRMLDGGRGIHEFPFFSFLLGDLHPHVMSIPFVLLAVGGALALFRSEEPLDLVFWLTRPLWLVAFAIMLGGLAFLNTWDMPTVAFVVVLAAALRNRLLAGRWSWGLALDTLGFALPLFLLAFLAYTPFFFGGFDSQADGFTAEAGSGTRLLHAFLIWGPFALLVLPYAAWRLSRHGERITWQEVAWSLAPALALFAVWFVWDILPEALGWLLPGPLELNDPRASFGDRLVDRGTNWLTAIFMAGALGLLVLALVRETAGREPIGRRTGHMFALALAAVAALLVLGVEFIYIEDGFDSRMNTIFKLYYQAWLLLSVAGGFALYELVRGLELPALRLPGVPAAGWRFAWGGAAAVVVLAAFVYPLLMTFNRTNGFDLPRTLDGLAYLNADERAAIEWLAGQDGRPVIVEAVGDDYTEGGRVSAATGLPTPLQWPGHELQWRGTSSPQDGRREAVDLIYTSTNADDVRAALQRFGITFVFLGSVERQKYPEAAPGQLDEVFDPEPAFEQGEVAVYRVRPGVLSQVARQ